MPNPWDPGLLGNNLAKLAALREGDKFSIGSNGQITVQKRGVGQGIARTFTAGASLLDDRHFLRPLIHLFEYAVAGYQNSGTVGEASVRGAYQGMQHLRATYQNSDGNHRAKVAELLEQLSNLVTEGLKPCVVVLPGAITGTFTINIMAEPKWLPTRDSLARWLHIPGTLDDDALVEQESTKEEIAQVFSRSPGPGTRLPTQSLAYKRMGLGICHQFWKDEINRSHEVDLIGLGELHTGYTGSRTPGIVKRLYDYLDKDEGMLFCVSQLLCQSGMQTLLQRIAENGTYQNAVGGVWQPLLLVRGTMPGEPMKKINLGNYNKLSYQVINEAKNTVTLMLTASPQPGAGLLEVPNYGAGQANMVGGTLAEHGVRDVIGHFSLRLVRTGWNISLTMLTAFVEVLT